MLSVKTSLIMRIIGLLFLLVLSVTLVHGQQMPIAQQQQWEVFRSLRPFPFQFVVWESTETSGTIILSEPPADLGNRQINRILRKLSLEGEIHTADYAWGQGGVLRDFVINVNSSAPDKLQAATEALAAELFSNPRNQQVMQLADLVPVDLPEGTFQKRSPNDLWIQLEPETTWTSSDGGAIPIADFLLQGYSGLLRSSAGTIALLIERSELDQPSAWEPFLAEVDQLLGGTWTDSHLLVFGRQRMVTIDQLEPLRATTVVQLIALSSVRSLLESRNPLCGPLETYQFWAPWYLSPGLEDTELGALLLWSEATRLSYLSGGRYQLTIPPLLEDISATTLNETMVHTTPWTTEGAFFQLEVDSMRWLGASIKGGLPLKNLARNTRFWNGPPRKNPAAQLDIGSSLAQKQHPVFIRTADYAFLHQLFRQAELETKPAATQMRDELAELVVEVFSETRRLEEEGNWDNYANELAMKRLGPTFDPNEPRMANLLVHTSKGVERELAGSAQLLVSTLDTLQARHGEKGPKWLAQALILPAPYTFQTKTEEDSVLIADVTQSAQTLSNGFRILAGALSDPVVAKDRLRESTPFKSTSSIITPRLVELSVVPPEGGTGQLGLMPWGGSTWPTWQTILCRDELQPIGEVRVEPLLQGRRVIFHPEDLQRVDMEVLNWVEKPLQATALKRKVEALLAD